MQKVCMLFFNEKSLSKSNKKIAWAESAHKWNRTINTDNLQWVYWAACMTSVVHYMLGKEPKHISHAPLLLNTAIFPVVAVSQHFSLLSTPNPWGFVLPLQSQPPDPVGVKRVWGNLRDCGSFPSVPLWTSSGTVRLISAKGSAECLIHRVGERVTLIAKTIRLQNCTNSWPGDPSGAIKTRSGETVSTLHELSGTFAL